MMLAHAALRLFLRMQREWRLEEQIKNRLPGHSLWLNRLFSNHLHDRLSTEHLHLAALLGPVHPAAAQRSKHNVHLRIRLQVVVCVVLLRCNSKHRWHLRGYLPRHQRMKRMREGYGRQHTKQQRQQ